MATTTTNICHALRAINQNENDLDELDQTGEIVANLTRIEEKEKASRDMQGFGTNIGKALRRLPPEDSQYRESVG